MPTALIFGFVLNKFELNRASRAIHAIASLRCRPHSFQNLKFPVDRPSPPSPVHRPTDSGNRPVVRLIHVCRVCSRVALFERPLDAVVHQVGFGQHRNASTIAQYDEKVVMHQHLFGSSFIDLSAMSGKHSIKSQGTLPGVFQKLKKQLVLFAAAGRQLMLVLLQHLNHECKQSVRLGRLGFQVLLRKHRKREIPDLGWGWHR